MIYYDSGRFFIAAENLEALQSRACVAAHAGREGPDIAWRPLKFSPLPYGPPTARIFTQISYAVVRGLESRLIQQTYPEAQGWPYKLLPQQHHSESLVHPTHESGLTGDLSLLIGLLAMTMPPTEMPVLLPELIAHDQWGPNWHTHDHLPAQSGCKLNARTFESYSPISLTGKGTDERGVYVKVFYHDQQVTPDQLKSYGAGEYGVLFCRS
jgi:hypothetical protein